MTKASGRDMTNIFSYRLEVFFIMTKLFKNDLWTFLSLHFLVWVGVPSFRKSIPLDSIEAITWGRYCDWGTNKHPPLSGFPADWFFNLFGGHAVGIYVLSQICVLIGFIYLYKLARCFLDQKKSVLAVMLLEGVIYYGFSAQEYNVNVVSLALWPLTAYYFYLALSCNKMSGWVLTGVFAGLNMLNKYVGGVLLIAMAAYLLFTKEGRAQFKKVGPYVTFAVFLLIIAPHVWWLYEHDFYPFEYLMGRTGTPKETLLREVAEHIYFPLKFLAAQLAFCLLAIVIYYQSYRQGEKVRAEVGDGDKRFLLYMGGLPVMIFAAISLVMGIKLKSMWGFPTLYLLGIMLFVFYPFKLNAQLYAKMKKSVYVVMVLFAAAALAIIFFNKSEKINFPGRDFAAEMTNIWKQRYHRNLDYVGGEIWYAANVSVYGEGNAKPVAAMRPEHNPWFDEQDIYQKGALVIFPDKTVYEQCRAIYPNLSEPTEYKLEIKNRLGKIKNRTVYYGFWEPSKEVNHE